MTTRKQPAAILERMDDYYLAVEALQSVPAIQGL